MQNSIIYNSRTLIKNSHFSVKELLTFYVGLRKGEIVTGYFMLGNTGKAPVKRHYDKEGISQEIILKFKNLKEIHTIKY